jgi:hypothetical protein
MLPGVFLGVLAREWPMGTHRHEMCLHAGHASSFRGLDALAVCIKSPALFTIFFTFSNSSPANKTPLSQTGQQSLVLPTTQTNTPLLSKTSTMDNYNWGFDNAVRLTIVIGFCIMNFIFLFGWTIWGIGFVFDRRRRSIKSDIEQQEFHLREIELAREMQIRTLRLDLESRREVAIARQMHARGVKAANEGRV